MTAEYTSAAMIKANGAMKIEEIIHNKPPQLLVLYDPGQEGIAGIIADVLGHTHCLAESSEVARGWWSEAVVGLGIDAITDFESLRRMDRTVVATHCIDSHDFRDEQCASFCDYEYLYTHTTPLRRDLARFLGFILGQTKQHEELGKQPRTTILSTTFPHIGGALPNLDIISVGADCVELRVDLLRDPATEAEFGSVPSLKYVGEQVMLLRQRTELPIIFTTRCTKENGRFPMDNPTLFYTYLRKALQWGCECIDVELWLPEDIRSKLAAEKGNSKIISAWHDFSGKFKWSSPEARQLFRKGAMYGDVVKMIALIHSMEDNYELEYFRSTIESTYSHPPFSGVNMGTVGQMSRTLNKVFTPITHPLLPMIAAPGQLSAAEINSMLHSMGQMPRLNIYAIGRARSNGLAMFFEKCVNELSQPHQLICVERPLQGSIDPFLRHPQFGGAYINPPLAVDAAPYLPTLTEAASAIGHVDTIGVRSTNSGRMLIADNVTWKVVRAALTRDFVPSAYVGREALVLANSEAEAAATIYALTTLDIGSINTIGFQARNCRQLQGLDDLNKVEEPFAIISALPADKSMVVTPVLLKYYGSVPPTPSAFYHEQHSSGIFIELSGGVNDRNDSVATTTLLGRVAYGVADVNAWTMVETLRLLIGQNVPWEFVRSTGGRDFHM